MNIVLWVLQGLLAFAMVAAGAMKLRTPYPKLRENKQMGWAADFTAQQVQLIGLAEVVGAVGLIVPWATGIIPILTPIAAGALFVLLAGAVQVHLKRKEPPGPAAVMAAIALVIALGRGLGVGVA